MNPWLTVPLGDYEGHLRSPGVDQPEPLSSLFADVLRRYRPGSGAILGIAGGNGLEHVDCVVTRRVLGLDIDADYLGDGRSMATSGGVIWRWRDVPVCVRPQGSAPARPSWCPRPR